MEPNCEFCNDTFAIDDWRVYMKAWRAARKHHLWMRSVTVEELVRTCRDIRDGVKTTSGHQYFGEDCPECHNN